jgi:hypothetical protein
MVQIPGARSLSASRWLLAAPPRREVDAARRVVFPSPIDPGTTRTALPPPPARECAIGRRWR